MGSHVVDMHEQWAFPACDAIVICGSLDEAEACRGALLERQIEGLISAHTLILVAQDPYPQVARRRPKRRNHT
jgi:hypothetical protein